MYKQESQQMANLLKRYHVTTEKELIKAIRDEFTIETGHKYGLQEASILLDQMLEAEYQRIEGGAYNA
jgi:hypothetical protein